MSERDRLLVVRDAGRLRVVRGDGSVSDRHVDGRDGRRSVLGPDMVLEPFVLWQRRLQLRSDVRSVCRAPWLRVVRHDREMPGRDLGGFNARCIVRRCELVLDDFDLRRGSLFVEHELLGMFSSRGLRLVRGLGDVSERQQHGRDGRLAMQRSAVVVDDIGVSERSVLLGQRDLRRVYGARELWLLLHDADVSHRQRQWCNVWNQLFRRELGLLQLGVCDRRVQHEHDVRVVRRAGRLRLVHRERGMPDGDGDGIQQRDRLYRNELGLADVRLPTVTSALGYSFNQLEPRY